MPTKVSLYDEVCGWVGGCVHDSPPPSPPTPTPGWDGTTCKNPNMPSNYCCPPGTTCKRSLYTKKSTGFVYPVDGPWFCVTGGDMIMAPIPAYGIFAKLNMCPQDYWGYWHREAIASALGPFEKEELDKMIEQAERTSESIPPEEALSDEERDALSDYLDYDRKKVMDSRRFFNKRLTPGAILKEHGDTHGVTERKFYGTLKDAAREDRVTVKAARFDFGDKYVLAAREEALDAKDISISKN